MGIEREVVAQHPGGFFHGDFAHHRDVVEDRRDVINQRE
jgi:hypothetical protein